MLKKHLLTSDQKLKWYGYGEWVEEPDIVKFEYNGFHCLIRRIFDDENKVDDIYGHLCGYIDIPKCHPFYQKHYDEIEIDVHGGLTFSDVIDGFWTIGFDCAHYCDYKPGYEMYKRNSVFNDLFPIPESFKKHALFNPEYRNIAFCIEQCKSMADQAKVYESIQNARGDREI